MMQHLQNDTDSGMSSPAKNVSDHETDSTLPNAHSNEVGSDLGHGSVMYDVEPFLKGELRSRVMQEVAQGVGGAGTVPDEPDEHHPGQSGAVPAHGGQGLQAEATVQHLAPMGKFVIETSNADVEKKAWEQWRNQVQGRISDVRTNIHANLFARNLPSHDECFAIVKAARDQIVAEAAQRRKRMDTPAGAKTVADYAKKCAQLDRELEDLEPGGPNPLMQVMGRHAGAKQSFSAIKTALKWRALEKVRELLKIQDGLQRAGNASSAWRHAVEQLRLASGGLAQIEMLKRDELLEMSGAKRRASRSKRMILPRLPDAWQNRFLTINEASKSYRFAGVLLRHCGMRPVELAMGVKLDISSSGLTVSIEGGKVRSTAGQPLRSFTLDLNMLPVWFVDEVRAAGHVKVVVHENALRTHLYRLSNGVFYANGKKVPNKAGRLKLSAYVFRHALVTELRAAGWEEHEIAAVLGETAAETARYYGSRPGRGTISPGTPAIVRGSVTTSRSVRPVDGAGLKTLMESKHRGAANVANRRGKF